MSFKRSLVVGLLCLASLSLQARNVFVLPANPGTTPSTAVFQGDPFTGLTTFIGAPSPFLVLSSSTGSKYYVVSKSATDTLIVVNGGAGSTIGSQISSRFNFGVPAEAAEISPDGQRLIVLAGTVNIIDTNTDQRIAELTLPTSATAVDVAFSLDSRRAYVLTRTLQGSVFSSPVYVIDLSGTTPTNLGTSFSAAGTALGIQVGPNGLVYTTSQNRIYELNANGGLRREIAVNGLPSELSFTPDGRFAVAGNSSFIPGQSSQIITFSLADGAVTPFAFANLPSVVIDRVIALGNTRFLAYSSSLQRLYNIEFTTTGGTLTEANFGQTVPVTGVVALTPSNEFPTPRYLYLATQNQNGTFGLSRVDVISNQIGNPLPLASAPIAGTGISYTGPAATANASVLTPFNTPQSVPGGTQFQPLIVRVTDSTGQPVSGAVVSFSSNNANATLSATTAITNNQGYAQITATAPNTAGSFQVTAQLPGGSSALFSLTASSDGTGGNPGGNPGAGTSGGLSILFGTGQAVRENFQTVELLAIQLRDNAGAPVANSPVSFTITSGSGTLQPVGVNGNSLGACTSAGTTVSCNTDANGQAGVSFLSSVVQGGLSFQPNTISATSGANQVNFVVTTYVNALPNGGLSPDPTVALIRPTAENRTITARAGTTVPGAIVSQVVATGGPQTGQGIPNIGLRASTGLDPTQGPTAACSGPGGVALSDATGVSTCDLVVGGRLGTAPLTITVGSFNNQGQLTLIVTAGDPARIDILQGNNQSGLPGQQLPQAIVGRITDSFGNPLSGVQATFTVVNPGTLTLQNVFATSDAQGRVSALVTLGSTPGPQQVRVAVGNITQTFTATVNAAFGSVVQVSGANQTAEISRPFGSPLVVRVLDTQGRPLPAVSVAFAVTSGAATLSAPSATTDANGQAQVNVTAGATPGPITITASAGGFTTAFNLTSRLPGPELTVGGFRNGASFEQGVVPGSIVTIFGAGLAPSIRGSVTPAAVVGPLPTTLAGVNVTFNGVAAPIYSVNNIDGQESVTVQVPFETAPGQAQVRVDVSGGNSTITVPVLPLQPAFFETIVGTARSVVAQRPDGSFVTPANPARRGETIRVYATGFGQVTQATGTNRAGVPGQRVNANLVLGLNYEGTPFISAEYAPGLIGVYVITFQVPNTAPAGNAIPLNMALTGPDGQQIFSRDTSIAIAQ
jgi:uncharacterized protein (TIGR03437 family)